MRVLASRATEIDAFMSDIWERQSYREMSELKDRSCGSVQGSKSFEYGGVVKKVLPSFAADASRNVKSSGHPSFCLSAFQVPSSSSTPRIAIAPVGDCPFCCFLFVLVCSTARGSLKTSWSCSWSWSKSMSLANVAPRFRFIRTECCLPICEINVSDTRRAIEASGDAYFD